MKLDLCIVSYNAADKLERLLDSLINHNDTSLFNIHIADNDSTDRSRDIIESYCEQGHIANALYNPNIGYSAACNQLASLGTGNVVGLLNSDVWFPSGTITQLVDSFNSHPDVAIIGPKQRDENGHITHAGIIGSNTEPKHRGWHVEDKQDKLFKDFIECVTVSGSAYFVRSDVWKTLSSNQTYVELYNKFAEISALKLKVHPMYWKDNIGAFLSTPHYYEETWCSYYARHLGYKVCYDGNISIGHSWHGSHAKGSYMDNMFKVSQEMFRMACDKFGIERD